MDPDWSSKVALPPFVTNETVLWSRAAAPLLLAVVVALLAITGCQPKDREGASSRPSFAAAGSPHEPPRRVEVTTHSSPELANSIVGRKCRLQIRRDALGMAGNAPAGMTGRWAGETSVDGTVLEMTDQWVVVQAVGKRVIVPHASILIIELKD